MSATPRTDILQWAMKNRPLTPREEEILNEMRKLEIESDRYKAEFLKCVEAASIFQAGGRFQGKLTLGRSTVVDGIAWLVSEYDRLTNSEKSPAMGQEEIIIRILELADMLEPNACPICTRP